MMPRLTSDKPNVAAGGDADVGGQHQRHAAAQAITVDGGDHRLPDFQTAVEQLVTLRQPHLRHGRRRGQKTLDVGAGGESTLARTRDDGHADLRVVTHGAPGARQALVVFGVHRVHALGPVDRDEGHSLVDTWKSIAMISLSRAGRPACRGR
jgi:hypothetical protein